MLTTVSLQVSPAVVASVMSQAFGAKFHWFNRAKVHVMQSQAGFSSPSFWSGPFLVRCEHAAKDGNGFADHKPLANGAPAAFQWTALDEIKLARAFAVLACTFPEVYARIVTGNATDIDANILLQFSLFGLVRFDVYPVVQEPAKEPKKPARKRAARKPALAIEFAPSKKLGAVTFKSNIR